MMPKNAIPSRVEAIVSAWKTPLCVSTVPAGRIASRANVPRMYAAAIRTPEPRMARGNVLWGSRTSSLIVEQSSSAVNANAICGQKFTVPQFHTGSMFDHVKCVTEPCVRHR